LRAGAIGASVGAGISLSINSFIAGITGEFNYKEIIEDAAVAGAQGFAAGYLAGAYGTMGMAVFSAFATMAQGLEFYDLYNDPESPAWQKYIHATGIIMGFLPFIAPNAARKLSDALQKFCFPAGTLVATKEGQKPIEEIREGDRIWSQSDQTGEITLKRVKHVFVNVAVALVVIHCGTNTLEATPEHPMWVVHQGWKAPGQIQPGDELWTLKGDRVAVTGIEHKQGRFLVYNFEVEDWHSYFVGNHSLLVHNQNCLPANKAAGTAWELKLAANSAPGTKSASQVTLKVQTPDGPVNIRIDELVKVSDGKYLVVEAKASATAGFTPNQTKALPLIGKGATVEVRGDNAISLKLRNGQTINIDEVLVVRPTGVEVVR